MGVGGGGEWVGWWDRGVGWGVGGGWGGRWWGGVGVVEREVGNGGGGGHVMQMEIIIINSKIRNQSQLSSPLFCINATTTLVEDNIH